MPRRPATLAFLALVLGVPLGQAAWELARGVPVQALAVFTARPSAEHLRAYEEELRRASFLRTALVPRYELALARIFGRGNEKVLRAREGWLFYAADLDYVTRREHFARAAADAVVDLREQLAARGVALLVVPVEPKSVVAWQRLGVPERPTSTAGALFRALLAAARVPVLELPADLEVLPRDTHWSPAGMRIAAQRTAQRARELLGDAPPEPRVAWREEPRLVRGAGDLVEMLIARAGFPRMELVVDEVLDQETGGFFHADRSAEVLLLGDSFTRVFGDSALGLGSSAGFDAHLARELGAGLDVIALPGGGARAVREALARRRAGLAGKRLVIWQLSSRDLVAGPERWERVDLSAGAGQELAPASEWIVDVELVERSVAPQGFDYATLLAVHEYRLLDPPAGAVAGEPIWVAHLVLRDHRPTAASSYAPGARQRLTLVPIEERYDLERTSWVDDTGAGPRIWFAAEVEPAD